jgi:hypothetical protein
MYKKYMHQLWSYLCLWKLRKGKYKDSCSLWGVYSMLAILLWAYCRKRSLSGFDLMLFTYVFSKSILSKTVPFGLRSDAIYIRLLYEHTVENGPFRASIGCYLHAYYLWAELKHPIYMVKYAWSDLLNDLHSEFAHGVLAEHGTTGHSLLWLEALMGSGSMIDITDG